MAMKCIKCGGATAVLDARPRPTDGATRRRRVCELCGQRFTTLEIPVGRGDPHNPHLAFLDEPPALPDDVLDIRGLPKELRDGIRAIMRWARKEEEAEGNG